MSGYTNIPDRTMEDVSTSATGNVTNLTISGLNGDQDGDYEFDFDLIINDGGSGNTIIHLRPFGASDANLNSYFSYQAATIGTFSAAYAGLLVCFGNPGGANTHFVGRGFMGSKTGGRYRYYEVHSQDARAASGTNNLTGGGWTTDTTTNITELTMFSSVASAIRTGSFFKVRKLKSTL